MTFRNAARPAMQRTLRRAVECAGVGLHCGENAVMRLRPAPAGHGIVFRRSDVEGVDPFVPARWDRVCDTRFATTIGNDDGVRVSTVEHLLAALAGCGVDNALVEISGPELPILDGSALPIVREIESAGVVRQDAPRRSLRILRAVTVEDGGRRITAEPADGLSIAFTIAFCDAAIGESSFDFTLRDDDFRSEISKARTFIMRDQIDALWEAGLARGGSLDNAVVIDGADAINPGGLRYPDECVRHKVLDCFGDLYLAGGPVLGRVTAQKSGHDLNNRLLRTLFADHTAWSWTTTPEDVAQDWHETASLAAG